MFLRCICLFFVLMALSLRACLLPHLKFIFLHFKQRYTYFHTNFYSYIFQKITNNIFSNYSTKHSLSLKLRNLNSKTLTCNLDDFRALNGFSSCLLSTTPGWNSTHSPGCCTWTGVTCDNSIQGRPNMIK